MAKRTYFFDIQTANGESLGLRQKKCFVAGAPETANALLGKEPRAAAVFAYDRGGHAAHAVYRS